jgi:fumarate reductase subunit C
MHETHAYTPTHPKALPQPVPLTWWLQKASYFFFMMRELSCIFVAWFVVFLLMLVNAVGQGAESYQEFLAWSATPGILLLNIVSLVFIVYHAVTFFSAAPQALVVKVAGNRVPGPMIAGGHYAGWLVVSAIIFFILVVLR